jgi:hypothetical protein
MKMADLEGIQDLLDALKARVRETDMLREESERIDGQIAQSEERVKVLREVKAT